MDINLVIIILLVMVLVGFSLHRSITLKSIDAQNKKFYDLNRKFKKDLEKCVTPEQSQAVITAFIFKSSALVEDVENVRRKGISKIKTDEINI